MNNDTTRKFHSSNPQSTAAAKAAAKGKRAAYDIICDALKNFGPGTSLALQTSTGIKSNTLHPRLSELKTMGRVRETGRRIGGAAELALVEGTPVPLVKPSRAKGVDTQARLIRIFERARGYEQECVKAMDGMTLESNPVALLALGRIAAHFREIAKIATGND